MEGLDLDDTDSSSIRTGKRAKCVSIDAVWWLDVVVGICGGFLLMVFIFQSSRHPECRVGERCWRSEERKDMKYSSRRMGE